MKKFIGIKLSEDLNNKLQEEAKKEDRSKSSVIRLILKKYFKI